MAMRSGDTVAALTLTLKRRRPVSAAGAALLERLKRCKRYWTGIDDLPDAVLVEILCRLPHKYARPYKRVCKRWLALISDSYFVCRHLGLQMDIDKKEAVIRLRTLLFQTPLRTPTPGGFHFNFSMFDALQFWETSFLGLFCIPHFEDKKVNPAVLAMYNDLALCCPSNSKYDQHDYHICNPNTLEWVALPPASRRHKIAQVGFICDPYWSSHDQQTTTGTSCRITINAEYRCRVVRIIESSDNLLFQFKVEIFASEVGEWRESVVLCPQERINFGFTFNRVGIAYNGMLYWPSYGGIIGLDLFALDNNNCECRFIEFDEPLDYETTVACLGVCQGRLRMCQLQLHMQPETLSNPDHDGRPLSVRVWELKDYEAAGGGVKWCLIHEGSLDEMDAKVSIITDCLKIRYKIRVLAVDPNNVDILYFEIGGLIIKCNIRARTLERPLGQVGFPKTADFWPWIDVLPYVLPRWPTPMPRLRRRLPPEHLRSNCLLDRFS